MISYSLSMIPDWRRVLAGGRQPPQARRSSARRRFRRSGATARQSPARCCCDGSRCSTSRRATISSASCRRWPMASGADLKFERPFRGYAQYAVLTLPTGAETAVSGWLALLAAGLLEIAWALGLKYSDGLTRFWPTAATVVAIALSFGLMAIALRSLPFGTAYAVWTGIGAVGSILVGMLVYSESTDPVRIALPDPDRRRHGRAQAQFAGVRRPYGSACLGAQSSAILRRRRTGRARSRMGGSDRGSGTSAAPRSAAPCPRRRARSGSSRRTRPIPPARGSRSRARSRR